jgi:aspartate/methionine/tyrosine aminotransferase
LLQALTIADKHRVPVIADEIYEHFVFESSGKQYTPMASLTATVPVLSCGGLTKRYLIPGLFRSDWIELIFQIFFSPLLCKLFPVPRYSGRCVLRHWGQGG